jgi:hypothetical protein
MPLYTRHALLHQTAYSDLKRRALEQTRVLVGTPGSVGEREVKGQRFHYRQFYDAAGKKAAAYVGPVGQALGDARAAELREVIETTNGLLREARELSRVGYSRVDSRTLAVLGAAANHALFRAGATLVGSHAYGVLLNESGVKAAGYATEDVDLARGRRLVMEGAEGETFADILAESTVPLRPVPGLGRHDPVTSYKVTGKDRFRVDLLVPTNAREVGIARVPELDAYATALPYLAYLLDDPMDAVVLGREGVVPVKVPRPEVFAWHKVLVSQLRGATRDKQRKDLGQAAVLLAVLAEDAPDALVDAFAALPRGTKGKTRDGGKVVVAQMDAAGDARGADVVKGVLGA